MQKQKQSKRIRFGNAVSKPQNFLALLKVRQSVTNFKEQSQFVSANFSFVRDTVAADLRG